LKVVASLDDDWFFFVFVVEGLVSGGVGMRD